MAMSEENVETMRAILDRTAQGGSAAGWTTSPTRVSRVGWLDGRCGHLDGRLASGVHLRFFRPCRRQLRQGEVLVGSVLLPWRALALHGYPRDSARSS